MKPYTYISVLDSNGNKNILFAGQSVPSKWTVVKIDLSWAQAYKWING
jgi:hypothetical protein